MLTFTVHTDGLDALFDQIEGAADKAELLLTTQVARDTERYVPMLTGSLVRRTIVLRNRIIYPGPYARYLYFGKVMKGPRYGPKYPTDKNLVYTKDFHKDAQAFWFEASKAQNLPQWLKTADKAVIHYLKK